MIRRYPKDSLEGRLQPLCAEHWLYRATVRSVKTELSLLHQLSYTAEELWGDCICELDRYRQDRPLYRSRCQESLLDFYNQICRRGKSFSEEHDRECKRLTGLFAAMLMLVFHRTQQNQGTLVMLNLMKQCKKMDIDYREMYDKLTYESDQYGYEQFTSQITEYLDGNVFLSEKIVETIESVQPNGTQQRDGQQQDERREPINEGVWEGKEEEESPDRLSDRQVVLLFSSLLGITLNAQDNNITDLSRMISAATGRKQDSVRTAIYRLKKEKTVSIKDLKKITALIEPFNPTLAKQIRDYYDDY